MNVLVACEFSGTVRDAFIARGHDAMSCDLIATERPGPHYTGDVFDVIDYPWDLGIFHFPCTHTSVSGVRHFTEKRMDGRQQAAVSMFIKGWRLSAHIPKVAFEHPVSVVSTLFRKPDQILQPWQFGHGETKAICIWKRGLPDLQSTNIVDGREPKVHFASPSPDRWKERSRTYDGLAQAMAEQWG
jgi:hypothetical protein